MYKSAWRHEERPQLGLLNSISGSIAKFAARNPGKLQTPCLGASMLVASDYGGEHKGARARTLAFLIVNLDNAWIFFEECQRIRTDVLGQERRMAYKSLGDRIRQQALIPFLRAANTLEGTLCVFCIDNKLSLFADAPLAEESLLAEFGSLSQWKRKSACKLLEVAHLGGALCSGFARPGQNIVWISDEDEFTAGANRVTTSTCLLGHVCSHLLYESAGHFRFGSCQSTDYMRQSEDLVAVPDLVAGALSEAWGMFRLWEGNNWAAQEPIRVGELKLKAHAVLAWLADDSAAKLGRLIVRLLPGQAGGVTIQVSEAHVEDASDS
ncbi:MAG: hypothetical protein HONBIEJF_00424 [Fimbriimonadaceae bacterium]|nr:hypothetical protein [Fimbriimonadaceae bacterium]